jgi:DNA-binding MarR family transcriptional regulator
MKVKNIKISIKSTDAFLEEAKSTMKKIMAGEKVSMKRGLYFENLDAMRPQSVYELAKGMNRDLKNVTQDLAFLERLGLVELKKTKNKRAKTTPSVEYDKILLEIAV